MLEKLQRFGGAMFVPVTLFAFNGLILAVAIAFQSELIIGEIAQDGTMWQEIWSVIEGAGWTVFDHMELLFVIGLPLGLASKASGRAAMSSFLVYMMWNNLIAGILGQWGSAFGVDYSQEVGGVSGLTEIAGVKTLDTNIIGAIVVAALVVWAHNKYFNKKLPEWLGIFQGAPLVVIVGFLIMLPLAVFTAWGWPWVQNLISQIQGLLTASGSFGVGIYVFLERILIPTGLHHFIYQPFVFGPAVVEGGLEPYWLENLEQIASTPGVLRDILPEGGFLLHNVSKVFAPIGIGGAFIATAKKEKRQQTIALILPTAITAIFAGITEPFEFTFLFLAPQLFLVHAILAGLLGFTLFSLGIAGDFGSGLINSLARFIIPMWQNHATAVLLVFGVGLLFSVLYFFIFRFAILKWDIKTPGREDSDEEVKMYSKDDYRENKAAEGGEADASPFRQRAAGYLEGLGGPDNITRVNNCATRLRISVENPDLVKDDQFFKSYEAHGIARNGKAHQVIVGLDAMQVREEFEEMVNEGQEASKEDSEDK